MLIHKKSRRPLYEHLDLMYELILHLRCEKEKTIKTYKNLKNIHLRLERKKVFHGFYRFSPVFTSSTKGV